MKREIIQTVVFEKKIISLVANNRLTELDFEDFKKRLIGHPEEGEVITGTSGIRKIRLKSASKGKKGGFRVCYLNVEEKLILFLIHIYSKTGLVHLFGQKSGQARNASCADLRRGNSLSYCRGAKQRRWHFAADRVFDPKGEQGPKTDQENLTPEEKKTLGKIAKSIKKREST